MKKPLFILLAAAMVSCSGGDEDTLPVAGFWQPPPLTTFQWQLTGTVNTSVDAQVFDIDAFEASKSLVDELHQKGIRVIGYISVGSYEDWRPDTAMFPVSVIGNDYEGWEGEKWLDIRRIDLLAPVLRQRLDMIRDKGFDAVEPDNIDGYENNTGFPITKLDEMKFIKWLADEAHQRGLSFGQKNVPDLAEELWSYCDWALVEDCFEDGWCDLMAPYIQHNKAVFAVEYTDA